MEDLTSKEFKDAARKAIFAIVSFIISYLLLLLSAIAFAVFCGILGVGLISVKVHWITLLLGLGLIGMGLIVVLFLIKFIFKRHKIDRSHLIELKEKDAPLLYQEIREIVNRVQTNFPKKIYISHEVNASVFYNSTFWSMIFPVRKNLQIGMALINSVSKNELKAILAHEFGHFSQRSMKVGSYVYTVNQIIFNLLYDNEGYNKLIQKLASISSYISIFVALGVKIIEGIQWVLKKLYNVVNLQHLNLSREMEFHADAIAVNTIGSKPFISSMMRLDLSNNSLEKTINYYEQKIGENIKPKNIYPQHRFVMNTLAQDTGVDLVNGLPNVTSDYLNRFNKSKLVIKNQWASHPSTEDRLNKIINGNFPVGEDDGKPATDLFVDIDIIQSAVTELLFANVVYKGEISTDTIEIFQKDYVANFKMKNLPKLFNGYYDNHNPTRINLEESTVEEVNMNFNELYTLDKLDSLYSCFSLESDILILKQLQNEETYIKYFEYDGVKYEKYDVDELLTKLEKELNDAKVNIAINDSLIYGYFNQEAKVSNSSAFKQKYLDFIAFDSMYDESMQVYLNVINETQFIQYTTPFEVIEENFDKFVSTEKILKEQIIKLLALPMVNMVSQEIKDRLSSYLKKEKLFYFNGKSYRDDELDILFNAIHAYRDMLYQMYIETKKILLEEMEHLQLNTKEVLN